MAVVNPGEFTTIVVDPPWKFSTSLPGFGKKEGEVWKRPGSVVPYPTMTVAQIAALPVPALAHADAHLYLWTVNARIEDAYRIVRGWGFIPSILLVWAKTPRGYAGFPTYSIATEYLIFCRRGTLKPLMRWPRNWFTYKRGRHSAKPPEFRRMIEQVSPGPRLELFARGNYEGWSCWGDECVSHPGVAAVLARTIESAAWLALGAKDGKRSKAVAGN